MEDYNANPFWESTDEVNEIAKSVSPSTYTLNGRPDKVSIGSGLPLSRKLNRLHPPHETEFCRFRTLGTDVAEFEVPNCFAMLSFTRRRVYEFARNMPFSKDELQDIMLAVGEAVTNAMKHGCPLSPCSVRIRMEKHSDNMRIFIMDNGTSSGYEDWIQVNAKTFDETGRGIQCMKAVMDEVLFHAQESGICVEMVKYVSGA